MQCVTEFEGVKAKYWGINRNKIVICCGVLRYVTFAPSWGKSQKIRRQRMKKTNFEYMNIIIAKNVWS